MREPEYDEGQGDHTLVLIAGLTGSGKTEAAKLLAGATGWALLDKDTLTRSLVEETLEALGEDPNTRESDLYINRVRPREYECLMRACWENVEVGASVIVSAPFLREIGDPRWRATARSICRNYGARLAVLWVLSDAESMRERLFSRGSARDSWKLAHWSKWLQTIDLTLCPEEKYVAIDNRTAANSSLAHQISEVASWLQG